MINAVADNYFKGRRWKRYRTGAWAIASLLTIYLRRKIGDGTERYVCGLGLRGWKSLENFCLRWRGMDALNLSPPFNGQSPAICYNAMADGEKMYKRSVSTFGKITLTGDRPTLKTWRGTLVIGSLKRRVMTEYRRFDEMFRWSTFMAGTDDNADNPAPLVMFNIEVALVIIWRMRTDPKSVYRVHCLSPCSQPAYRLIICRNDSAGKNQPVS